MEDMTIKEAYASAIKDFEVKSVHEFAGVTTGYLTQSGKIYSNYYSNDSFKEFVDKMPLKHRRQYDEGSGGELREKEGRYGYYPPKMASFASSSRMIYLLSKDIEGFTFEQNLSTGLGGPANLDGFRFHNGEYTFVEAKRQEIFDSHSPVREAYRKIYNTINEDNTPFTIKCNESVGSEFKPIFYCKGKEIHYFDLKQMISHMLGIARAFILGQDAFTLEGERSIRFLYLLYNPDDMLKRTDSLSGMEKKKIQDRYNAVVEEINLCAPHMETLFREVFRIQAERENVKCEVPLNKFSFKLVDQKQYKV